MKNVFNGIQREPPLFQTISAKIRYPKEDFLSIKVGVFCCPKEVYKTGSNFLCPPFWSARKALWGDDARWLIGRISGNFLVSKLHVVTWSDVYSAESAWTHVVFQWERWRRTNQSGEEEVASFESSRVENRWTDILVRLWNVCHSMWSNAMWSWRYLLQRTHVFLLNYGGRFVISDLISFESHFSFSMAGKELWKFTIRI